jgi:hypothetical protein
LVLSLIVESGWILSLFKRVAMRTILDEINCGGLTVTVYNPLLYADGTYFIAELLAGWARQQVR